MQEACSPLRDLLGNSIFDYKSCEFFYPGALDFRGDMQSTSLAVHLALSEFYKSAVPCFALLSETVTCLK